MSFYVDKAVRKRTCHGCHQPIRKGQSHLAHGHNSHDRKNLCEDCLFNVAMEVLHTNMLSLLEVEGILTGKEV